MIGTIIGILLGLWLLASLVYIGVALHNECYHNPNSWYKRFWRK